MTSQPTTLYLGYGSNLWRAQMKSRCPKSIYIGVGRLLDYTWIINSRGYANVVQHHTDKFHSTGEPMSIATTDHDKYDFSHEVWGLVYTLTPEDEANLDINEGVPDCYTKETLTCEFWNGTSESNPADFVAGAPVKKDMLVYVDRKRIEPVYAPKREYVYRMNRGIEDALDRGVPRRYVEDVLRPFIPVLSDEQQRSTEGLAARQAHRFLDENDENDENKGRDGAGVDGDDDGDAGSRWAMRLEGS